MRANDWNRGPKAARIRLVIQLREAYRRFADLLQEYRGGSPAAAAAVLRATQRLSAMNRALALAAVQSTRRASIRR